METVFSRYLATASSDNTVKIWNVDGFTLEKTLVGMYFYPLNRVFFLLAFFESRAYFFIRLPTDLIYV